MLLRWLQPALLAASLAAITTASFAADSAPFPSPAPVVYVADFDLDVANVKPDSGPVAVCGVWVARCRAVRCAHRKILKRTRKKSSRTWPTTSPTI